MRTTVCVAGDSILMKPMPEGYKDGEYLRAFIARGDARINNLEMIISDYDCHASTFCGGIWLTAEEARLDEIISYGFNCFGFANNHTMDYSYGGLESTLTALKLREVPVCGAGLSLSAASAPAVIESEHGTVAVFSITTTCDDAARAGNPKGRIPARPGLNMLRHTETFLLNEEHLNEIRKIAEITKINGRIDNSKRGGYTVSKPGIFSLGNIDFKLSDREGKSSAPHPADMLRMENAVKKACAQYDYVIMCVHSHEIKGLLDEEPDYFLETFARACIDWGVAAVIGSGTHQIKALELYRGKPIFYSIANFIFQSEGPSELPADYFERYGISTDKTAQEAILIRSDGGRRGLETEFKNYMGLLPLLTFEDGELAAIEILPLELNFAASDRDLKGLPRVADEKTAARIFATLSGLSRPLGTDMTLSDGRIFVRVGDVKCAGL